MLIKLHVYQVTSQLNAMLSRYNFADATILINYEITCNNKNITNRTIVTKYFLPNIDVQRYMKHLSTAHYPLYRLSKKIVT